MDFAQNDIDSMSSSVTTTRITGWEDVQNVLNHILLLEETNFHETINGNSCMMILFYAKCEYTEISYRVSYSLF